jgi:hypothetical protein
LDVGGGYNPRVYKRMLRRLRRKLEDYARFSLDLLGGVEGSPDVVESVRARLEELIASGGLEQRDVDKAKAVLEFLRSAPGWQVELFRKALNKELSRRAAKSSKGQVKRSQVGEWRRTLKEIRRLKDRLRGYADYVLDIVGDLDDSVDLVDQVRDNLELLLGREDTIIPDVVEFPSGEKYNARTILEFIKNAPPWQLDMFRKALEKELYRRRRLQEDIRRIEEALEKYIEERGVHVPFHIIEFERIACFEGKCHYMFKVEIGSKRFLDEFEGTLEELIDLFKGIVDVEAENVEKLVSKAERERRRAVGELRGFQELLIELEKHIYGNAILTISGHKLARPRQWEGLSDEVITALNMGLQKVGELEIIKWDASRLKENLVVYGADPEFWPEFYKWLSNSLKKSKTISILLRSFTKKVDETTGLPIKEIRGYIVSLEGNKIKYHQLTARELLEAYTRDPETGKRIEPEPAVIFCGPGDEKIYPTP